MEIKTRIQGIPAMVRVDHYTYLAPDSRASSDWDYYGGWQLEYTICDRNGREAPWLEKKMTRQDHDTVEQLIIQEMHYDYCDHD